MLEMTDIASGKLQTPITKKTSQESYLTQTNNLIKIDSMYS